MFDTTGIILNTFFLRKTANRTFGGFSLSPFLENQTAGARKLCKLQDTEFPSTFWEVAGHWPARAASSGASRWKGSPGAPRQPPTPPGWAPAGSAAPRVAFLAAAKASHSCAVAAKEQAQPKFSLLKAALTLTWISAWKSSGLAQGNALDSGWSFALAAWQGSSSAESQQNRFTGSRGAEAIPQGRYPPWLLPAACVNWWSRQQGSAYNITQPPSPPTLRDQLDLNPFCSQ